MDLLWLMFIILIVVTFFFKLLSRNPSRKCIEKIPGPTGFPILGNVLEFCTEHTEYVNLYLGFCRRFKDGIFKLWLLNRPYVFLYEAKYVESILSNTHELDKSVDYKLVHPWLGTGLLTSTGDKWRCRRKLLTPAFHFSILKDFIPIFNEQSQILLQHLEKEIGSESFNIMPYITRCTLDIICASAMGQNINAQGNKDSEYVKALCRIGLITLTRIFRPWYWSDWIFSLSPIGRDFRRCLKTVHDFTNKVIRERRKNLHIQNDRNGFVHGIKEKKRLAFLDLLLTGSENGQMLSDEDIREEVDTFMFEGHETTAAGITWALYLLGRNKEQQKTVHEELDKIFGNSNRPCNAEDLVQMKYLECVIKESLRIFPSIPIIGRYLKEKIELEEYTLPAGTTIACVPLALHRNPEVFPDPEAFIPERFLPDNTRGRHPYAYIPFSAGPRNCIGQKFALMEEKIILSTFLRKFEIKSLTPRENIKVISELMLRPLGGLKVNIIRRQIL